MSITDPTGLFGIYECMAAIAISNILACNAFPSFSKKNNYKLLIYMDNFLENNTEIVSPFWQNYGDKVIEGEKQLSDEAQKKNVKFTSIENIGPGALSAGVLGDYIAVVSHTYKKGEGYVFSHFDDDGTVMDGSMISYNAIKAWSNHTQQMFISACWASQYANGPHLSGNEATNQKELEDGTQIDDLISRAVDFLLSKMKNP